MDTETSSVYRASAITLSIGAVAKDGFIATAIMINDEEPLPSYICLQNEDSLTHKAPIVVLKAGFVGKNGFNAVVKEIRLDISFTEFPDCSADYFRYAFVREEEIQQAEKIIIIASETVLDRKKILYPNPFE